MQVSTFNYLNTLISSNSLIKSDGTAKLDVAGQDYPSEAGQFTTANGNPTEENGFFGASQSTLRSSALSGKVVNTLSYITNSDMDLIQKTTGITVKDGSYFNSSRPQVGIHYDNNGSLSEPDANNTLAAVNLAQSLSEMRKTGGPESDASLQSGRTIKVDDLQKYLDDYSKAAAAGYGTYSPDATTIKQAEALLGSDAKAS